MLFTRFSKRNKLSYKKHTIKNIIADKKKKDPEENSNDDDESDDSESLSDKDETESPKKLEKLLPKPIKLLNEAELAKLAVLATSSDSSGKTRFENSRV